MIFSDASYKIPVNSEEAHVIHKTISVRLQGKQTDIGYLEVGSGDRILVLISGILGSMFDFSRMLSYVPSAGWRVIAVSLPGSRPSPRLEGGEHSIELHADVLIAFLDAMRIAKVHGFGLSAGGLIVLQAYRKQPWRFITVSGQGIPDGENVIRKSSLKVRGYRRLLAVNKRSALYILRKLYESRRRRLSDSMKSLQRFFQHTLNTYELNRFLLEPQLRELGYENVFHADLNAVVELVASVLTFDVRSILPGVRVPVFLCDGEDAPEWLQSAWGIAEALPSDTPRRIYTVPRLGHMLTILEPGRVLAALVGFILDMEPLP